MDVGDVSADSARLFYADEQTRLAYMPADNFTGAIHDLLKIKAWGRSSSIVNGASGINTNVFNFSSVGLDFTTNFGGGSTTISNDGQFAYVADRGLKVFDISGDQLSLESIYEQGGSFSNAKTVLSNQVLVI